MKCVSTICKCRSCQHRAKFYLISSAWLTMWRAYIDDDTAAVIGLHEKYYGVLLKSNVFYNTEPFESRSLLCRHKGALVPLTFRSHFTLSTHSICKVIVSELSVRCSR